MNLFLKLQILAFQLCIPSISPLFLLHVFICKFSIRFVCAKSRKGVLGLLFLFATVRIHILTSRIHFAGLWEQSEIFYGTTIGMEAGTLVWEFFPCSPWPHSNQVCQKYVGGKLHVQALTCWRESSMFESSWSLQWRESPLFKNKNIGRKALCWN